jgi:hypothetical protein
VAKRLLGTGLHASKINPDVVKVGGLQSQDVEGKAVVCYCEPSTTQDLKSFVQIKYQP